MLIYITEATLVDHPEYEVLFGKPTSSKAEALSAVKEHLAEEMADDGEVSPIVTTHVSDNQLSVTYEGALNTYYITTHEV